MASPINQQEMEAIVHSTEDAVILECLDQIGQITYREALDNYNAKMRSYIGFVNDMMNFRINEGIQIK